MKSSCMCILSCITLLITFSVSFLPDMILNYLKYKTKVANTIHYFGPSVCYLYHVTNKNIIHKGYHISPIPNFVFLLSRFGLFIRYTAISLKWRDTCTRCLYSYHETVLVSQTFECINLYIIESIFLVVIRDARLIKQFWEETVVADTCSLYPFKVHYIAFDLFVAINRISGCCLHIAI